MADPFSAWGAEASPARLIDRDAVERLVNLSTAEGRLAQAELHRAQIGEIPSQIRWREAQAAAKEHELQEDKRLKEALAQMAGQRQPAGAAVQNLNTSGAPNSPEDMMTAISQQMARDAEVLMQGGFHKEARELMAKASNVMLDSSRSVLSRARAKDVPVQQAKHEVDLANSLINGAYDERSAAEAEQRFQQATGRSLYGGRPWSPELNNWLRQQLIPMDKQLQLQLDERRAGRIERMDETRTWAMQEAVRQREAELERRKAADAARKKAVGKPARPSSQAILNAKTFLRQNLEIEDPSNLHSAAEALESRAMRLMSINPTITVDEARARAFVLMRQAKDFDIIDTGGILGTGIMSKKVGQFTGGGKTPDEPLYAPMKAGKVNIQALHNGRWYVGVGADGQPAIGRWDRKKGELTDLRPMPQNSTPLGMPEQYGDLPPMPGDTP